jgi:hypothetical protein
MADFVQKSPTSGFGYRIDWIDNGVVLGRPAELFAGLKV